MLRNNRCVGMVSRAQLVNDSGDMLSGGFVRDSSAWSIPEGRVDTLLHVHIFQKLSHLPGSTLLLFVL